ncbi:GNAT family N-acetyltransferase [Sphingopyxis sp. MSC1_008]|jgi:RimJ/RimL family protein N-acetyltransferase|uniref:GNAT family N-acetyltransferase n=1 Tax=Sphingopyxis sp. MSC1_008 TaxID=2909265 RepID=UPI0020C118C6|nr:GNAT family protein [Sphingopyxis sp. MSC1_008]
MEIHPQAHCPGCRQAAPLRPKRHIVIVETTEEDYSALTEGRAPRDFELADTPIGPPGVLEMLAEIAAEVRQVSSPVSWLIIEENEVVGLCSITRPPKEGVIDIGYGIAPSRHGRGIASRAIGDIVSWAMKQPALHAITAETSIANLPSERVLVRNGFRRVGERLDDQDGPLNCWRLSTSP